MSENGGISVFGLGYVGTITAASLAQKGWQVVGVDVNPAKVGAVSRGFSPVVEPGLSDLVHQMVRAGRLRATTDHREAVAVSNISLVCVGTPSAPDGGLDLTHVRQVIRQIGKALRSKGPGHVVVVRSTMLPGCAEAEVLPLLERESAMRAGADVGFCVNPEFLREGSSLRDFEDPPFTLIGELDARSGERVAALYGGLQAPVIRTDLRTAEMLKYASNAWHALKISFANEIGNFCQRLGVDSHRLMEIFCRDTKLNISSAYLRPGFAFGGSCLPKDLRALLHRAQSEHLELPVLEAIPRSNELQARLGIEMVLRSGKRRVGVLGFSFKEDTDDLRESPMVLVIETLIGKGYDVMVYDADVALGRVTGANKRYIEQAIPHIASIMYDDPAVILDRAEVVVIGKRCPKFRQMVSELNGRRVVVDLVRLFDKPPGEGIEYKGICW